MNLHNEGNWRLNAGLNPPVEVRTFASGRAVERRDAPMLALDESGVIVEWSEPCAELFGYQPGELDRQHVSRLYPQLSGFRMFQDGRLNPMLRFLCHCGHPFEARNKQGASFKSELRLVDADDADPRSLRLIVRPLADRQPPRAS